MITLIHVLSALSGGGGGVRVHWSRALTFTGISTISKTLMVELLQKDCKQISLKIHVFLFIRKLFDPFLKHC